MIGKARQFFGWREFHWHAKKGLCQTQTEHFFTERVSSVTLTESDDSIKSEFSEDKIGTFLGQIFLMVVCQQEVSGAFALWDILLYVLWEHAADRVLFLEA